MKKLICLLFGHRSLVAPQNTSLLYCERCGSARELVWIPQDRAMHVRPLLPRPRPTRTHGGYQPTSIGGEPLPPPSE